MDASGYDVETRVVRHANQQHELWAPRALMSRAEINGQLVLALAGRQGVAAQISTASPLHTKALKNQTPNPTASARPSPPPIGSAPPAVDTIDLWIWGVLAGFFLLGGWFIYNGFRRKSAATDRETAERLERFGVVITVVAMIVAAARAVIVPSGAKGPWVPNLDVVTLGWVALAIAGGLLPLISDVSIGTVSLKLKTLDLAAVADDVLRRAAALLDGWGGVLNEYFAAALHKTDGADLWDRLDQFIAARLAEASTWLEESDDPNTDEPVILTVWLVNRRHQRLEFTWASENRSDTPIVDSYFGFTEGIAGTAFTEHSWRNEVNPAHVQIYKKFDDLPYPYKSMLVGPIDFGTRRLGVLCIDRMLAQPFDEGTKSIGKALASIIGAAIGIAELAAAEEDARGTVTAEEDDRSHTSPIKMPENRYGWCGAHLR